MSRSRRSRRRITRRGASPILATVFLVALTIVAGTVLWGFRPSTPSSPVQIWYAASSPVTTQAYGDGSDCKNVGSGANATQVCETLPAIDIVVTGFEPSGLALSSLQFYFFCRGSVYLSGTLAALEWVPGSQATVGGGPGSGVPALGTCGSYVPPAAAFNRFMYFQQLRPGSPNLEPGDQLVIQAESFSPPSCAFAPSTLNICWISAAQNLAVQADAKLFPSTCPSPAYAPQSNPASNGSYGLDGCDDDYHGVPTADCYTVTGACSMVVATIGPPASIALRISTQGLFPAGVS